MDFARCESTVIHNDVVDNVKRILPEDDLILDLADTFKLFADSTRVKILYALTLAELCVCDISALLGMSMSSVSHQLRILKMVIEALFQLGYAILRKLYAESIAD